MSDKLIQGEIILLLVDLITLTISTMLKSYKSLFNGVRVGVRVRVRVSFFKHSKKVMFLVDLFEINLLFSC